MNEEKLSFSIVICTYNRDEFLERTLVSLNNLTYSNFEVIVVNGPSTDRTDNILKEYSNRIKIEKNDFANLSISRNIGIKAANGDIVAFLDDDAIPEPNWLNQIKELYDKYDPIGGAGGRVYGPGGDHFQFHNGYIDVWGEAVTKLEEPGIYVQSNSDKYNIMMGVNSTFDRNALMHVGGFDEYYEYFHDESDLCARLTRSGYPIYHHQEAFVHHEFARSHIRKSNYKLNWYPIVKNTVYFGVKNSIEIKSLGKRLIKPFLTARKRAIEFDQWRRHGNITIEDYRLFMKMWWKGVFRGYIDGFLRKRKTNYQLQNEQVFMKFNKVFAELDRSIITIENSKEAFDDKKFGICLISRHYPPFGSGGVATYTRALAEGLVEKGFPVFVLTTSVPAKEQKINGVCVIRVDSNNVNEELNFLVDQYPITNHNIRSSLQISNKIEELYNQGLIKIVETPLWDYEGLATTQIEGLKTIVRLETPLRKAAEMQGWNWNHDMELSAHLEKKLIETCDGVISISNNVKTIISQLYNIDWSNINTKIVPLGLLKSDYINTKVSQKKKEEIINILFVGRLEPRKGIDLLLKAFHNIAQKYLHVKLNIVGNNSIIFDKNMTMQQIFEKEASSELLNRVTFFGEVSNEELEEKYQECDIFVAPSRYESFGLVYLEAMKYKKPVIGCNVGGIPEVITDGMTGLLVEPCNISELELALVKLILNENLRKELGQNAYDNLLNVFTVESMVNNTLKAYNSFFR
ncbi:glycosyltransferase [Paenibacillus sp. Soil724D2]|uniref:glycosyltransferase n=1 Tax=Paenibacillus sp. (strain Soil724D2) TaxID=1736392 RepID=UPI0007123F03|nr:glycosyltransferase [Paenibacillus sp. Soil724D2]KRE51055.1 hypothetical protein ASG85_19045 [Paenibacillus sp. Soil724D2]